jgi:hypothetical protein
MTTMRSRQATARIGTTELAHGFDTRSNINGPRWSTSAGPLGFRIEESGRPVIYENEDHYELKEDKLDDESWNRKDLEGVPSWEAFSGIGRTP